MELQEEPAQLSRSEKKKIKVRGSVYGIFFVIIMAIVIYIAFHFFKNGGHGTGWIFILIPLLIAAIPGWATYGVIRDLKEGMKIIYTGEVTDKERRKSSGKNKTVRYYMTISGKTFNIEQDAFHKANVGNKVALHYSKRAKISLKLEVLERNNSPGESITEGQNLSVKDLINKEWAETKVQKETMSKKEMPLEKQDLKRLAAIRNSKISLNVFLLFVFGVFFLAFSLFATAAPLFFLPAAIFFVLVILCIKWITGTISKYTKDKKAQVKLAIVNGIRDKQTRTRKGQKTYTLLTNYGNHSVTKEQYDSVKGGEQIISFHGKHSNWLIDFRTSSEHS